ncbi:unnamed protein product [Leuciscus chuanchicus]
MLSATRSAVLEKPTLVPSSDAASEHCPMASASEEGPPLSGQGLDLASAPRAVVPSCLGHQRVPADLPSGVLNTITQARAPSTRRLYSSKWSVFSSWSTARGVSPPDCGVTEVLSFLQELLDKGRSPSMLKVYVAAIAAFSKTTLGQSIGRNDLVIRFLRGAKRLNPPRPPSVPVWDLSVVLEAMKDSPQSLIFKPTDLKEVMEETTVSLSCSAEAPCPKQPPTISWSNIPESGHITTQLQEKPDKTQSVFSHMTFKASYMDHRKNISCTATYPRKTSNDSTVETTVMLQVLFPPKETCITIDPSASVSVGTNVTLTCKSKANPSNNMTFSWHKRGQENQLDLGEQLIFTVNRSSGGWYSCKAKNEYGTQRSEEIQLIMEVSSLEQSLIIGCVVGVSALLLTFLLITLFLRCLCVYIAVLFSDTPVYNAKLPSRITALSGSCVQIPCTFEVPENVLKNAESIFGFWIKHDRVYLQPWALVVYNGSTNISKGFSRIEITGNLSQRECTTVFYDVMNNHSDNYYFRYFITCTLCPVDSPQPLILKPTDLKEVMENTTVSLSCSAEAPCPKQPPTISWSNIPESGHITTQLQDKPNKTQSVFSNMTFKASYMDHRKNISCTATYPRKTSKDSTVETTVMLQVLFPPKETRITIDPSASVSVGTNVTLTCKSKANPSNNMIFSWHKRGQENQLDLGEQLIFTVNRSSGGWYSCKAKNEHGTQMSEEIQLIVPGTCKKSM